MTNPAAAHDPPLLHGLAWLIRLRWLALSGQLLLALLAAYWLKIALPWPVLLGCMGCLAVSNLLIGLRRHAPSTRRRLIALVVFGDMALLTVMLYFAGGAHNPFTLFYIVHIALVAILLPGKLVYLALGVSVAGFVLLFTSPHQLESPQSASCCNDMEAHLRGMTLSLLLTGAAVSYFVTRLGNSLREADRLLQASNEARERQERFKSLATLAAGVAHELATPLGTIAVIGSDLERNAALEESREDGRMIRQEVERCRAVMQRLAESARQQKAQQGDRVELQLLSSLLEPHLPADLRSRLVWEMPRSTSQAIVTLPLVELLQSLAVLVRNACEASEAGSKVILSVNITPDEVIFTVEDHGHGMDSETLERIGEPFYTRKAGGMGLGLFLTRLFCEKEEGSLRFLSQPGVGTKAILTLPRQEVTL